METGTDLIRDHSNYETHSQESQEASDTRLASSIEPTPVSSSQVLLSSAQGPSEGFHASVEDRKKNSSPTSAVAVLGESIKAIVILDAITGYVLVERFYDWPESLVTNEVYKLSSLIKSLYQFSRELEDGSLLSVDFEGYPGSPMSPKSKPRRLPKRPAQQHRGLLSPYQTMRMMCKSSEVIVALFVDMNGELTLPPEISKVLGGFVDHLMEAFIVVYGKLFASLREGSTYSGSATVKTSSSYSESLGEYRMKCPNNNNNILSIKKINLPKNIHSKPDFSLGNPLPHTKHTHTTYTLYENTSKYEKLP